jgi:hypothetical protein
MGMNHQKTKAYTSQMSLPADVTDELELMSSNSSMTQAGSYIGKYYQKL